MDEEEDLNNTDHCPVENRGSLSIVLRSGLCVGCGVCAGLWPDRLKMEWTPRGEYVPVPLCGGTLEDIDYEAARICPFSGLGANEDLLGARLYGNQAAIRHSVELGFYLSTYTGWVTEESDRLASSAGGLTTWVLRRLLENQIVDGVICVSRAQTPSRFFEYRVIRNVSDFQVCRKSRYYPVELSRVISELSSSKGRFAVVGLPCFIKALRLAIEARLLPKERIYCVVGLFCGHLKTNQFASYLIRCCGFHEERVIDLDFRKKLKDQKASDYAFEATAMDDLGAVEKRFVKMKDVLLGNWGLNAFMLKACECCDDIVAELADISFGDAWLPEFVQDGRGTNVVICRREDIRDMLLEGAAAGDLALRPLEPEEVLKSQDGSFRQRRQALSYRLYLSQKRGEWRPPKRMPPDRRSLRLYSKVIQWIRIILAERTKVLFCKCLDKNISHFSRRIYFWVMLHNTIYRTRKLLSSLFSIIAQQRRKR